MNKYTIKINNYFVLSLLIIFSSCDNVAKFDSVAVNSGTAVDSDNDSSSVSSITFSGIDSISNVTDSTATINWTHVAGANQYQIFSISGDTLSLIDSVNAPTASYNLSGLTFSTTISYRVRLVDSSGKNDINTKNVSITTSSVPNIPSGLALFNPTTTIGYDTTPTITVSGVKSGDTIKLFSDNSCVTEIGSSVSTGATVSVTSSTLVVGDYVFYANATGSSTSNCSSSSIAYNLRSCPVGYIIVPSNATVGAPNDFCVMKYEAKAWNDVNTDGIVDVVEVDGDGCNEGGCTTENWGLATYKPGSIPEGGPWRRINQLNSWDECDSLNSEGNRSDIDNDINIDGTFALISNPEWMAIARNIENVASNWTDGTVGSGCLKRGNMGSASVCLGGASGYNGPDPDFGTGRSDNNTSQLTLDNAEVIWDFSGNIWSWTDWTLGSPLSGEMSAIDKPYIFAEGSPQLAWREFDVIDNFSILSPTTSVLPSDSSLNSSDGIGSYYAGNSGGSAIRGGHWSTSTDAGAFALGLNYLFSSTSSYIGFRCVFRFP